jgi:hypothetical protein
MASACALWQTNGFGFLFHSLVQTRMSASSCSTNPVPGTLKPGFQRHVVVRAKRGSARRGGTAVKMPRGRADRRARGTGHRLRALLPAPAHSRHLVDSAPVRERRQRRTLASRRGSRRARQDRPLARNSAPRLAGHLEDRSGHHVGPVLWNVMAGAVDDDMASPRGCGGEPFLQAGPVRAEPATESAGSAQDDDRLPLM